MRIARYNAVVFFFAALSGLAGGFLERLFFPPASVSAQSKPIQVLRAQKFELVTSTGSVRAVLDIATDGTPTFKMGDTGRSVEIAPGSITVQTTGSETIHIGDRLRSVGGVGVHIILPGGATHISTGNHRGIVLKDDDGAVRVILALEKQMPALMFWDKDRQIKAELGAFTGGRGFIGLYDQDGTNYWSVPRGLPNK